MVSVRDDGPGFPPGLVPHAFEPFVTGRTDTDHSGLGLAIVAEVTRRHGGRVHIADSHGHGEVVVRLPLAGG